MANAATESSATTVTMVIESRSPHETKSWGRRLASILEGGELLGLIGDLGAGKTVFIKGLRARPPPPRGRYPEPDLHDDPGASRALPALSYRSLPARRGRPRRPGAPRVS